MAVRILIGDCIEQMRTLPDDSVQCVVTSPPYYGLRDYQVDGQIGLESSIDEWVGKLVDVFREVRRVLRPDGLCWVNLGDSYASVGGVGAHCGQMANRKHGAALRTARPRHSGDIKEKDLIGQPWMVAFALRADGWWLRDAIVWHKLNPMPESTRDRCTKAYEMVFMLSKSPRYFFDQVAISEPASENTHARLPGNKQHKRQTAFESGDERHRTKAGLVAYAERQRAKYKMPDGWATHDGGHGTFHKDGREKGAPAGRKLAEPGSGTKTNTSFDAAMAVMPERRNRRNVWSIPSEPFSEAHFATFPTELPRLCILASTRQGDTVLDPFGGAGTTGLVADRLQRHAVLCELNPEYAAMARRRIDREMPLFAEAAE